MLEKDHAWDLFGYSEKHLSAPTFPCSQTGTRERSLFMRKMYDDTGNITTPKYMAGCFADFGFVGHAKALCVSG